MSNFLIYTCVYGTAIVFNSSLETLVPHALATRKFEVTGHLLNRAQFLWLIFFGLLFAGMFNIDTILVLGLEWDDQDAERVQEYMVWASPALFFWGIMDIHRRFINSYQKFWTPCISMGICVACHPFVCHYFIEVSKWGMKGLAISQLVTNFASYFFMRALASCNREMGKSIFCPSFKTCSNIG